MEKIYLKRRVKFDERRSYLLLGPRRTGKSTLLKHSFPDAHAIDLLKSDVYFRYRSQPAFLRNEFATQQTTIIVDEIQLIPELLREIHWLIENSSNRFIVSGSSARKLRRLGLTNLAGRLRSLFLKPLTSLEIPDFDLMRYLQVGGLPPIWFDSEPNLAMQDYCGEYLKEEIQAEGLVRNLPAFTRFLETSAYSNGQLINYANIARDLGLAPKTVREYYQILEDTLMGFHLMPYTHSKKRRPIMTPKFYWFDCGIPQTLLGRTISEKTPEFGTAFEHFIVLETQAALTYEKAFTKIHYWRSASGFEVDLLLDEHTAIEIKAGPVNQNDCRGLNALSEELPLKNKWIVSRDPNVRTLDHGVLVLPWQEYVRRIAEGEF